MDFDEAVDIFIEKLKGIPTYRIKKFVKSKSKSNNKKMINKEHKNFRPDSLRIEKKGTGTNKKRHFFDMSCNFNEFDC